MRTGIIGWQGFIGSYLKDRIKNPILFNGDMRRLDYVKMFVKDCDRIYHVAGKNRDDEGKILENNLVSTGNLILAVKNQDINPEIIFVSSKQAEWNADSEYGLSKLIEEEIVKRLDKWCIYRVPNVYGCGGRPFYNSVVATFTYQISHDIKVTINNPEEIREFVYIDDLLDKLLKPKFSQYVNVEGEVMSIGEIYNYLTSNLGAHGKLEKCLDYWRVRVSKA